MPADGRKGSSLPKLPFREREFTDGLLLLYIGRCRISSTVQARIMVEPNYHSHTTRGLSSRDSPRPAGSQIESAVAHGMARQYAWATPTAPSHEPLSDPGCWGALGPTLRRASYNASARPCCGQGALRGLDEGLAAWRAAWRAAAERLARGGEGGDLAARDLDDLARGVVARGDARGEVGANGELRTSRAERPIVRIGEIGGQVGSKGREDRRAGRIGGQVGSKGR